MGKAYEGKNGNDYELTWSEDAIVQRLLSRFAGEEAKLVVPSSNEQCKKWAVLIRNNIGKIKRLRWGSMEFFFEVIDGEDIHQLFTRGPYKRYGKWVDVSELESTAPEPMDEYMKTEILEFADFLDASGGLVKPRGPLDEN